MEKNITVDQHFIPKFYQKQWIVKNLNNKRVYRLNTKEKIIETPSIRNNFQESFFYEYDKNKPTNFIEHELKYMEDEYINIIRKQIPLIENGIKIKFSEKEKTILIKYIVLSTLRTSYEINKIEQETLMKYFYLDDESEDAELKKRILSRMLMIFPEDTDLYETINSCYNAIIIANDICFSEKIPYIVRNCFNLYKSICFTDELFYLGFPLSPKILIVFSNVINFNHKKKSALNIYNYLISKHNYICSNSKDTLKKFINN